MTLDATFWVAISFIIFLCTLVYLKVPQLINKSLKQKISDVQKELDEAEKLKEESKNLLNKYENILNESTIEVKNTINLAKKESEKNILEITEKFYKSIESKKLVMNEKIQQMKKNALAKAMSWTLFTLEENFALKPYRSVFLNEVIGSIISPSVADSVFGCVLHQSTTCMFDIQETFLN